MADKKITELTELVATPDPEDLYVMVDDPGGTPETKKIKFRNALGTRYLQFEPFSMRDAESHSTGDGKAWLHIPPDISGMDLVYCHARLHTAGTTGTLDIQIYNVTDAVDMLSTKITVDSAETGSETAAVPYVINTSYDDIATNDILRVDIDAVHTTVGKGLLITLGFK